VTKATVERLVDVRRQRRRTGHEESGRRADRACLVVGDDGWLENMVGLKSMNAAAALRWSNRSSRRILQPLMSQL
jgi:hypothetical protein